MKYCLTLPNAKCPTKKHPTDAAWDLYTPCSFLLKSGGLEIIDTGFKCQLPSNTDAVVRGKSKLGRKGVIILGGEIDNEYIGSWGIVMYNCNNRDIEFNIGDAIAQFRFVHKVFSDTSFEQVESLDSTQRGISGIWSEST